MPALTTMPVATGMLEHGFAQLVCGMYALIWRDRLGNSPVGERTGGPGSSPGIPLEAGDRQPLAPGKCTHDRADDLLVKRLARCRLARGQGPTPWVVRWGPWSPVSQVLNGSTPAGAPRAALQRGGARVRLLPGGRLLA